VAAPDVAFFLFLGCRFAIEGSEPGLNPIRVEAARIGPEHDLGRRMKKLPADDDLIASAGQSFPDLGLSFVGASRNIEQ
jgi:hypothetical protein